MGRLSVLGFLGRFTAAQYDFPVDSCACHIHYEYWVQLQYRLTQLLTADFPSQLFQEGSLVRRYVHEQDCRNPHNVDNILEWTIGPANSDCVPGHVSHYITCAQAYLLQGDIN